MTTCDIAQYLTVTTEGRKEEWIAAVATVDSHPDKASDEGGSVRHGHCAQDPAFALLRFLPLPSSARSGPRGKLPVLLDS